MAYIDKYGVEYSDDKKTLVRCPEDFEGEYIIPEGVVCIGNNAFAGCSKLTSITIPESTTTIEWGAFGACESLSKVYYSGDIKHWCKLLWNDDLGSNIGPHDLYIQGNKITELVLPNDITIINAYAFYNCICLMSIYIPDSVTCIK